MFQHDPMRTGFSDEIGQLDGKLTPIKLRWDWHLPNMVDCMQNSSPVLGDINGDGILEIVVAASNTGILYVLQDSVERIGSNLWYHGKLLWSYQVSGIIKSSPLLFDINNSGTLDVIFGSWDSTLYALDGNSGLLWSFPTGGMISSSPVAGDIDNDGTIEIIVGSDDSCLYVLWWFDGSEKWKYKTGGMIRSSPAIGDINGDDTLEIFVGSSDGKLYALSNGDTLWTYDAGDYIYSSPALGYLDGDDTLDVVFGCHNSYVYALKGNDGSFLWSYKTDGYIDYQSPALADIDGDGLLEVIIGSFGGECVYAIEGESGIEKWKICDFSSDVYPVPCSPAIADIDKDGELEILMSIHNGYCYAWEADGSEQWQWGYSSGDQDTPLALGDIDGDGELEVVGSDLVHHKIFVLDFPVPPIGVEEDEELQVTSYKLQVYPNPFTQKTEIRFQIPDARYQNFDIRHLTSNISLTIHDLSGRLVREFSIHDSRPTTHEIMWDGTDNQGNKVNSGVYFCRIEKDGTREECMPTKLIYIR